MINGFPKIRGAYNTVDNNGNKNESVGRIPTNDGNSYYPPPVPEMPPSNHQQPDIPPPTASWNYNPYFSSYYNYYPNNPPQPPPPPPYDLAEFSQYENQKYPPQYTQNVNQAPMHSTSVLHCCDPRCQLLPEHSKYPISSSYLYPNKQQRRKLKSGYNEEISLSNYDVLKTQEYGSTKCMSYVPAPFQNDLNNKYARHPPNYDAVCHNVMRHPKHTLIPTDGPLNDYYSKNSYCNRHNNWNKNPGPPSYYPSSDQDREYNQKLSTPSSIPNDYRNISSHNQHGILFNRLLDHHDKQQYDQNYMPPDYYSYNRQPTGGCVTNMPDCRIYNNNTIPIDQTYNNTSHMQISNNNCHPMSYFELPNTFDPSRAPHKIDNTPTSIEPKQHDTKSKNQNLDVREFLSTWDDDVEDDKVTDIPVEPPMIVLDCTTLEGDVLDKVKQKFGTNFQGSITCDSLDSVQPDSHFTSQSNGITVLKLIDDNRELGVESPVKNSPCMYSGQDEYLRSGKVPIHDSQNFESSEKMSRISANNDKSNDDASSPWCNNSKQREEMSYDLVEMTERLVNTVDRLFSNSTSDKSFENKSNRVQNKTSDMSSPSNSSLSLSKTDSIDNYNFVNLEQSKKSSMPSGNNFSQNKLYIDVNYKKVENVTKPVEGADDSNHKLENHVKSCEFASGNRQDKILDRNVLPNGTSNNQKEFNIGPSPNMSKDSLPSNICSPDDNNQHFTATSGNKSSSYMCSHTPPDLNSYENVSCNLNVQKTNPDLKNSYSLSMNYSKQSVHISKNHDYSPNYNDVNTFDENLKNDLIKQPSNNSEFYNITSHTENHGDTYHYNNTPNQLRINETHLSDFNLTPGKLNEDSSPIVSGSPGICNNYSTKDANSSNRNNWYNYNFGTKENSPAQLTEKKLSLKDNYFCHDKKDTIFNSSMPSKEISSASLGGLVYKVKKTSITNNDNLNIIRQNENVGSPLGVSCDKNLLEIGKMKESGLTYTKENKLYATDESIAQDQNCYRPYFKIGSSKTFVNNEQPYYNSVIQKIGFGNVTDKKLEWPSVYPSSVSEYDIPLKRCLEIPSPSANLVSNIDDCKMAKPEKSAITLSLNDVYENDNIFETNNLNTSCIYEENWSDDIENKNVPTSYNISDENLTHCSSKSCSLDDSDGFETCFKGTDSSTDKNDVSNYFEKDEKHDSSEKSNNKVDFNQSLWENTDVKKSSIFYTQPLNLAVSKDQSIAGDTIQKSIKSEVDSKTSEWNPASNRTADTEINSIVTDSVRNYKETESDKCLTFDDENCFEECLSACKRNMQEAEHTLFENHDNYKSTNETNNISYDKIEGHETENGNLDVNKDCNSLSATLDANNKDLKLDLSYNDNSTIKNSPGKINTGEECVNNLTTPVKLQSCIVFNGNDKKEETNSSFSNNIESSSDRGVIVNGTKVCSVNGNHEVNSSVRRNNDNSKSIFSFEDDAFDNVKTAVSETGEVPKDDTNNDDATVEPGHVNLTCSIYKASDNLCNSANNKPSTMYNDAVNKMNNSSGSPCDNHDNSDSCEMKEKENKYYTSDKANNQDDILSNDKTNFENVQTRSQIETAHGATNKLFCILEKNGTVSEPVTKTDDFKRHDSKSKHPMFDNIISSDARKTTNMFTTDYSTISFEDEEYTFEYSKTSNEAIIENPYRQVLEQTIHNNIDDGQSNLYNTSSNNELQSSIKLVDKTLNIFETCDESCVSDSDFDTKNTLSNEEISSISKLGSEKLSLSNIEKNDDELGSKYEKDLTYKDDNTYKYSSNYTDEDYEQNILKEKKDMLEKNLHTKYLVRSKIDISNTDENLLIDKDSPGMGSKLQSTKTVDKERIELEPENQNLSYFDISVKDIPLPVDKRMETQKDENKNLLIEAPTSIDFEHEIDVENIMSRCNNKSISDEHVVSDDEGITSESTDSDSDTNKSTSSSCDNVFSYENRIDLDSFLSVSSDSEYENFGDNGNGKTNISSKNNMKFDNLNINTTDNSQNCHIGLEKFNNYDEDEKTVSQVLLSLCDNIPSNINESKLEKHNSEGDGPKEINKETRVSSDCHQSRDSCDIKNNVFPNFENTILNVYSPTNITSPNEIVRHVLTDSDKYNQGSEVEKCDDIVFEFSPEGDIKISEGSDNDNAEGTGHKCNTSLIESNTIDSEIEDLDKCNDDSLTRKSSEPSDGFCSNDNVEKVSKLESVDKYDSSENKNQKLDSTSTAVICKEQTTVIEQITFSEAEYLNTFTESVDIREFNNNIVTCVQEGSNHIAKLENICLSDELRSTVETIEHTDLDRSNKENIANEEYGEMNTHSKEQSLIPVTSLQGLECNEKTRVHSKGENYAIDADNLTKLILENNVESEQTMNPNKMVTGDEECKNLNLTEPDNYEMSEKNVCKILLPDNASLAAIISDYSDNVYSINDGHLEEKHSSKSKKVCNVDLTYSEKFYINTSLAAILDYGDSNSPFFDEPVLQDSTLPCDINTPTTSNSLSQLHNISDGAQSEKCIEAPYTYNSLKRDIELDYENQILFNSSKFKRQKFDTDSEVKLAYVSATLNLIDPFETNYNEEFESSNESEDGKLIIDDTVEDFTEDCGASKKDGNVEDGGATKKDNNIEDITEDRGIIKKDVNVEDINEDREATKKDDNVENITEDCEATKKDDHVEDITEDSVATKKDNNIEDITEHIGVTNKDDNIEDITEDSVAIMKDVNVKDITEDSRATKKDDNIEHITEGSGTTKNDDNVEDITEDSGATKKHDNVQDISEDSGDTKEAVSSDMELDTSVKNLEIAMSIEKSISVDFDKNNSVDCAELIHSPIAASKVIDNCLSIKTGTLCDSVTDEMKYVKKPGSNISVDENCQCELDLNQNFRDRIIVPALVGNISQDKNMLDMTLDCEPDLNQNFRDRAIVPALVCNISQDKNMLDMTLDCDVDITESDNDITEKFKNAKWYKSFELINDTVLTSPVLSVNESHNANCDINVESVEDTGVASFNMSNEIEPNIKNVVSESLSNKNGKIQRFSEHFYDNLDFDLSVTKQANNTVNAKSADNNGDYHEPMNSKSGHKNEDCEASGSETRRTNNLSDYQDTDYYHVFSTDQESQCNNLRKYANLAICKENNTCAAVKSALDGIKQMNVDTNLNMSTVNDLNGSNNHCELEHRNNDSTAISARRTANNTGNYSYCSEEQSHMDISDLKIDGKSLPEGNLKNMNDQGVNNVVSKHACTPISCSQLNNTCPTVISNSQLYDQNFVTSNSELNGFLRSSISDFQLNHQDSCSSCPNSDLKNVGIHYLSDISAIDNVQPNTKVKVRHNDNKELMVNDQHFQFPKECGLLSPEKAKQICDGILCYIEAQESSKSTWNIIEDGDLELCKDDDVTMEVDVSYNNDGYTCDEKNERDKADIFDKNLKQNEEEFDYNHIQTVNTSSGSPNISSKVHVEYTGKDEQKVSDIKAKKPRRRRRTVFGYTKKRRNRKNKSKVENQTPVSNSKNGNAVSEAHSNELICLVGAENRISVITDVNKSENSVYEDRYVNKNNKHATNVCERYANDICNLTDTHVTLQKVEIFPSTEQNGSDLSNNLKRDYSKVAFQNVPRLKFLALEKLADVTFGQRNKHDTTNRFSGIKVCLLSEKTEIIIQADDEDGFFKQTINNSKLIHNHNIEMDNSIFNNNIHCRSVIISRGESVICLNCSLNSLIPSARKIDADKLKINGSTNTNYKAIATKKFHKYLDLHTLNNNLLEEDAFAETTKFEDENSRDGYEYLSDNYDKSVESVADNIFFKSSTYVHDESLNNSIYIDDVSYNTEISDNTAHDAEKYETEICCSNNDRDEHVFGEDISYVNMETDKYDHIPQNYDDTNLLGTCSESQNTCSANVCNKYEHVVEFYEKVKCAEYNKPVCDNSCIASNNIEILSNSELEYHSSIEHRPEDLLQESDDVECTSNDINNGHSLDSDASLVSSHVEHCSDTAFEELSKIQSKSIINNLEMVLSPKAYDIENDNCITDNFRTKSVSSLVIDVGKTSDLEVSSVETDSTSDSDTESSDSESVISSDNSSDTSSCTNKSARTFISINQVPRFKVQLPWDRIFDLRNDSDALNKEEEKSLVLGPAKIEVHLCPDGRGFWKVVDSKSETSSPVSVKVKRLIFQRATTDLGKSIKSNGSSNSVAVNTIHSANILDDFKSFDYNERTQNVSDNDNAHDVFKSVKLPKVVIKKTSPERYESYFQPNRNLQQPVICLVRSKNLDELALNLINQHQNGGNLQCIDEYHEDIIKESNILKRKASASDVEIGSKRICTEQMAQHVSDIEIEANEISTEELVRDVSYNEIGSNRNCTEEMVGDISDTESGSKRDCTEEMVGDVSDMEMASKLDCTKDIEAEIGSTWNCTQEIEVEIASKQNCTDKMVGNALDTETVSNQICTQEIVADFVIFENKNEIQNDEMENNNPEIENNCSPMECVNENEDILQEEMLDEPFSPSDEVTYGELHHCLLCHRSYPNMDLYRIHMRSRFHRHVELVQRKTIHAMYRHFTGYGCPRLRPLTRKEKKRMRWKPSHSNIDHFYHQMTPLQVALRKPVFSTEDCQDQENNS